MSHATVRIAEFPGASGGVGENITAFPSIKDGISTTTGGISAIRPLEAPLRLPRTAYTVGIRPATAISENNTPDCLTPPTVSVINWRIKQINGR